MSVAENMSFALRLAKADPKVIDEKVRRAAQILNLEPYLARTPRELSGGQRQRVAIGRAIVRSPKVFLFDEPLSNLDAALRGQTRVEIAKLHRDLNATTIYVTHDQVEAMTLADRVVVLRDGQIEQVGSPLALYDKPANQFVAQFIGTPQMNVLPVAELPQLQAAVRDVPSDGFVGLRPESLALRPSGGGQLQGTVELVEALGAETLIYVNAGTRTPLVARQSTRPPVRVGDRVGIEIDGSAAHRFDAQGRVAQPVAAASH
jgi:multiple sugar transport system ATP-binding protein